MLLLLKHQCPALRVMFAQQQWSFFTKDASVRLGIYSQLYSPKVWLSGPSEPFVSYSKPFHKFLAYLE